MGRKIFQENADTVAGGHVLDLISIDHPGRIFASIHFGWESPEFYREWAVDRRSARGITLGALDASDFNCDWADVLLKHVRKEVLADSKTVARFKKHYAMCKRAQRKRATKGRAEQGPTGLEPGAACEGKSP